MIGSTEARIHPLPVVTNARWAEEKLLLIALFATDVVAVALGFLLAYLIRFESGFPLFYVHEQSVVDFYSRLVFWLIPLWLLIFAAFQLYDFHILFGGTREYAHIFNACTTGMMAVIVASFLYPDLQIARGWLLLSWVLVTGSVAVGRFTLRRVVYRMRTKGRFLTAMLIVGANEEGIAIAEQLMNNPKAGVWLAGFLDDHHPEGTEVLPGLRVLGPTAAARTMVHRFGVQEVVVASTALPRERLLALFQTFGTSEDVNVRLSSGLFEIMTTGLRVKEIGNIPLLSVNKVRLTGLDVVLKTVLDYTLATLALLALWPLFLIIAIAIKRDSPGPIFYRRRVIGVGGRPFDALKFRTMYVNGDEILAQHPELLEEYRRNFKLKDDPRVTRVGRFLRRTSLDELPQLINVLRGEMSLVGPRMITAEETAKYGKWRMNLLTVKPGITGLWQVSGRSDVSYEERVRMDMHYIRNYSIWLDLQILFQTVPAVLKKRGAY